MDLAGSPLSLSLISLSFCFTLFLPLFPPRAFHLLYVQGSILTLPSLFLYVVSLSHTLSLTNTLSTLTPSRTLSLSHTPMPAGILSGRHPRAAKGCSCRAGGRVPVRELVVGRLPYRPYTPLCYQPCMQVVQGVLEIKDTHRRRTLR